MNPKEQSTELRINKIRERLAILNPTKCDIFDDSAAHAGHAGAASGAGHFRLTIASAKFNGLKSIERHRLVYDAVGDLMTTDIHVLVINAIAL